ncbi:MAG: TolC family protein [Sphaerochaetaceae bacterium]|nr:TolC family protein [Sphaerochaetaceae bacterium]
MKKRISLLFTFVIIGFPLFASIITLSESDAVTLALNQNYELKSSLIDLQKVEDQKKNSWNVMLPDFSIEGSVTNSNAIFGSSNGDYLKITGSLSSSVTLNKYDKYYMEYDKLNYESELLNYEDDQKSLEVEVQKAFYYLLANKQSLDIQKMNLDLALKRWEQMQSKYDNGLASELEVLETQSTYENLKPSYTTAYNSYQTQLMNFKSFLGIDLDQDIELNGDLDVEILDLDADALISTFLNNRIDIQNAQKAIDLKTSLYDIEKASDISPSLALSLDYSYYNSDLLDSDWSDSASVTATISIPLNGYIEGSEEDIAISDAQRSIEQSQLSYESAVEDAQMEIKTLVMEIEGYKENIDICEIAIDISQKTYDATEEAYNLGATELLNLTESQTTLFSAKQDLLTSQYNYLSAVFDLEKALNASVDEIKSILEL